MRWARGEGDGGGATMAGGSEFAGMVRLATTVHGFPLRLNREKEESETKPIWGKTWLGKWPAR